MGFGSKIAGAASKAGGKLKGGLGGAKNRVVSFGGKFKTAASESKGRIGDAWGRAKEGVSRPTSGTAFEEERQRVFGGGGGGGGGGGLSGHGDKIKKILIIVVIIAIAGGISVYFLGVGGGNVVAGDATHLGKMFADFTDSFAIRKFMNVLTNPFGLAPTGGEFEETKSDKAEVPNQAFDVEVRGFTETVEFGQKALTFFIQLNNKGSSRIQRAYITLEAEDPFDSCIKFDNLPASCIPSDNAPYVCWLDDIAPFSSKELIVSSGYVDGECIEDNMATAIKPEVPITVRFTAKGHAPYPATSRLSVERVDNDYGLLLFKNQILRQENIGAIYMTGTAMTIDLDIGRQPILDTVTSAGLLMRWQNIGSGQLSDYQNPFIFVLTPKEYGQCIPSGFADAHSSVVLTEPSATYAAAYSKTNLDLICSGDGCNPSDDAGKDALKEEKRACVEDLGGAVRTYEEGDTVETYCVITVLEPLQIQTSECDSLDATTLNPIPPTLLQYKLANRNEDCPDKYVKACQVTYNAQTGNSVGECEYDDELKMTQCCCVEEVKNVRCVLCGEALNAIWCDEDSHLQNQIRLYAPDMKPVFDWACNFAADPNSPYEVCGTNALGTSTEFDVFTCNLTLPGPVPDGVNRQTDYITAAAIYSYEVEASSVAIKTYCMEGNCP